MNADISGLPWMDPTTRARALQKLSLVSNQVGYPQNPANYSDLPLSPLTYALNTIHAQRYKTSPLLHPHHPLSLPHLPKHLLLC